MRADSIGSLEQPPPLSPAGSKCSTAAPPTPASAFGTPPLDPRELVWLEDEDDDEIMRGMPLWSVSSSSLGEGLPVEGRISEQ